MKIIIILIIEICFSLLTGYLFDKGLIGVQGVYRLGAMAGALGVTIFYIISEINKPKK